MHENRETSEMPEAVHRDRPAGQGKSRKARAYVFEESDSGTVCAEQRIVQEGFKSLWRSNEERRIRTRG